MNDPTIPQASPMPTQAADPMAPQPSFSQSGGDSDFRSVIDHIRSATDPNGQQRIPDDAIWNDYILKKKPQLQDFNYQFSKRGWKSTQMLNYLAYGNPQYQKPEAPPEPLAAGLDPSEVLPQNYLGQVGQGIGNDISQAASGLNEVASNLHSGRRNLAESVVPAAGAMAGGVANVLAEPLKPIVNAFTQLASAHSQEADPFNPLDPNKSPQLAQQASDFWNTLQASHPALAENLKGAAQMASLPAAMQGASSTIEGVSQGVEDIGKGAMNQMAKGGAMVNKALGVDPEKIAATKAANEGFTKALNTPKTAEDISVPARSTANDIEASKNQTAIIKDGKITGYKPNDVVAKTIKEVAQDPNNIPQTLGDIQNAKGSLSDEARAELTKQNAGKINEFQTQRYQTAAVKDLRGTLSEAMQTPENDLHFVDAKDSDIQQKVASQLESRYTQLLKQTDEKEVSKLDLRQWIDKQIPSSSFGKDMAELPANTRSLMIFRRALNSSIDENAKAIGGQYQKLMDKITNLYKAEETVATHMPKPETIMQQFTVPEGVKLPNEVPKTSGQILKGASKNLAKKVIGGTVVGAGIGEGIHLVSSAKQ